MTKLRRFGRWALIATGGALALLVLLRVGLGIYLNTAAGKAFVGRQISARIGMPVEVTNVRLGLRTCTIGLKVFDPSSPNAAKEVFAVDSADADISLFGLARGDIAPKTVELKNLNLQLHISADGKVLTTLPDVPAGGGPAAIPAIRLAGGQITLRQDGRPEFALTGVDVLVEPQGDRVKLSGTIDDPKWSKWTVKGEIHQPAKTGSVELSTPDGPLTMDRLTSIPFVPAEVWKHVGANGRGAVTVKLWTGSDREVHYSVEIRPSAADLTLPDADITLTKVEGLIRVSGAKVELQGTKAALAGGTFTADGTIDFGPEPTTADLKATADGLDVTQLPSTWGLPRDIEGKLQGGADLKMKFHQGGQIETAGGGAGEIVGAKIRGIPVTFKVELRSDGQRYRFDKPAGEKNLTPRPPSPRRKGEQDIRNSITFEEAQEATRAVTPFLLGEGSGGLGSSRRAARQCAQPPKQPPPKGGLPTTLDATIALRDIDIAELLQKLEVKLGYRVSGKVTAELTLAVPIESAASRAAYEFTGKVSSPELKLEGLTIRDLSATATYKNGKLTLTELKGAIQQPDDPKAPPGTFRGTATAAVDPAGDVTASLTLDRIPLGEVLKAVPDLTLDVEGIVSGTAELRAPYEKLSDPNTWAGSAELSSPELVVAGRSTKAAKLSVGVAKGAAKLKVDVFGGALTGSAEVPFATNKGGTFDLAFKDFDVATATTLIPDFPVRLGGRVSGSVKGTIDPAKEGQSRVGNLDIDLTAPKLTVQGIPAERLVGKAAVKGGVLEYSLEGKTLGGSFELKGRYPGAKKDAPAPPAPVRAGWGGEECLESSRHTPWAVLHSQSDGTRRVPTTFQPKDRGSFRLVGADLSRVATELGFQSLRPLRGRLDVSFDYDNDLSAGSGRIVLTGLTWGDSRVARDITAIIVLRNGVLEVADVSGGAAGGTIRGRARVFLNNTDRNFFSIAITGADAKRLFAVVPDVAELVDGSVSVVVRGRIGPEMRGSGTLTMERGTVAGVAVAGLRVPFDWATAPGGYGRFAVRDASVSAGSGTATANLTVDWGVETRVDGQVKMVNVPLRTIAPGIGEFALLGNGRITGRFDLTGRNVRSADDLNGTLLATLGNTSPREVPIIERAVPFLNPAGLVKPFETGDVRASLSRGVFRVQRLALVSPNAQLFAEGNITTSGRVDLNVVAHTGTIGPEARAFRALGLRLPAIGPIPVGLLRDLGDLLSNRTIRLSITGSVSDPQVKVNVGAIITEEVARFFLSRYVPGDAAGVLGVGGYGSLMNDRK